MARLLADDTAASRPIRSRLVKSSYSNQDLHRFAEWKQSCYMAFRAVKRSRRPVTKNENLHGQLGIIIREEAGWDIRTDALTAKANRTLGLLTCNVTIRSLRGKANLVFVTPILEYASCVWDPTHQVRSTVTRSNPYGEQPNSLPHHVH